MERDAWRSEPKDTTVIHIDDFGIRVATERPSLDVRDWSNCFRPSICQLGVYLDTERSLWRRCLPDSRRQVTRHHMHKPFLSERSQEIQ